MSENPQKHDAADVPHAMAHPAPKPQPPPKRERPLAPTPRDADADATTESRMQIVDDDDAVLIPELAPERIASASLYGAPRAPSRDGAGGARSLFFRRTMIPILLTCGVMFPALAALWFSTGVDHVVRRTGRWLPVTLVVLGAVFLLLAVVNMVQVKHLLARRREAPATPR